jgi:hypothetical protein
MAILFDKASSVTGLSITTITWSHDTAAGDDRLIYITAMGGDSNAADRKITSASYNAVAATKGWRIDDANWVGSSGFWVPAPTLGSNTVSATYGGFVFNYAAGACTFTGVFQPAPVGVAATATGSSATPSVLVLKTAADQWVIGCLASDDNSNVFPTGTGTERWEVENIAGDTSTNTQTATDGVTDYTLSWSQGSTGWAVGGQALIPTPDTARSKLGLLGVG